ncbi:MAG TPA: ABC transporter permease [Pelagibacterium sp.]|uniref:ABC transporter permease n=1 Tax=Pelagibacterium sp. TaxID=1967288 RepID=UPI002B804FA7|nr:ABC transporter permease [Pelagibacterium sp.]HWJ88713.1 ABC transporter permease [Pelagibacterium sp.]
MFSRVGQAMAAALAATLIVWLILPLAPGDPVLRILAAQGIDEPNELQIDVLRAELALDRPLPVQYIEWLGRVVQGDLSVSYRTGQPVLTEIASRLPATALLLGTALAFSVFFSLILALIAVHFRDRWPDRIIRAYTQITASVPTFIFALLVLQYVVLGLGIGKVLPRGLGWLVLLPALTLAIDRAGGWTQLLRASLLEHIHSGPVLVARSRGATRWRTLWRHALPNSLLPYITAIGVSLGAMIGGTPIIEEIFTWPGLGRLMLLSIQARDFPVIQAFVLLGALCYVTASMLVDLVSMAIDPRLREAHP